MKYLMFVILVCMFGYFIVATLDVYVVKNSIKLVDVNVASDPYLCTVISGTVFYSVRPDGIPGIAGGGGAYYETLCSTLSGKKSLTYELHSGVLEQKGSLN